MGYRVTGELVRVQGDADRLVKQALRMYLNLDDTGPLRVQKKPQSRAPQALEVSIAGPLLCVCSIVPAQAVDDGR